MNGSACGIDIKEKTLHRSGELLDILLIDRTTKKNIVWATDSYENRGNEFSATDQIKPELVTGEYHLLIQPRAAKNLAEQQKRTKEKAEVFTPLKVVDQINKIVDVSLANKDNWQAYVREPKLEITCGEAPFIVSRYNPTAHTGKLISLDKRVGFLDKKLRVVSKYCDKKVDWLFWAKEAFKACYGYEWQGDNVLLARENLLYTFIDYYQDKFNQRPTLKMQEDFAGIISWNIFQMDGLRYVVPMSCRHESKIVPSTLPLFEEFLEKVLKQECSGCKSGQPRKHNGNYAKIMDWEKKKAIKFVDLIK